MLYLTTPRELNNRGLWVKACDILGMNEWAMNEGLIEPSHEIRLTEDQARRIGLVVEPPPTACGCYTHHEPMNAGCPLNSVSFT